VVSIKITVFWDVMPSTLVDMYQRFYETYCPQLQGKPKMEAQSYLEKLAPKYQTTRRHIPKYYNKFDQGVARQQLREHGPTGNKR
jgi:hypothetical protein